jgi:hypothetical protein
MDEIIGTICLPSVKARTETSGSSEKFLDDHCSSAGSEDLVDHHGRDGFDGLPLIHGDDDPFPQRKSVRLYDDRVSLGFQICHGLLIGVERAVCRGRDLVSGHQIFCERFAALDPSGFRFRAEAWDADAVEPIHEPERKRIVWSHDSEIDRCD